MNVCLFIVKSEGLFDQFRRECLADVDTKPAFQNVQQRVEAAVSTFLDGLEWKSQLNKNQLREKLRKSINKYVEQSHLNCIRSCVLIISFTCF